MDETVFTTDHAPPHTDYYPLCVALAQAWPIDKLVTREKKNSDCDISAMVHAAIHAQQEMATLRGTSSPAVLKIDADKKKDGFYGCGSLLDLLDVAAPRYTHHTLRTASLSGTCNKSTTLKTRCGTNVQPNFTIAAQST